MFGAIREGREVHTVNTKGESIYFLYVLGLYVRSRTRLLPRSTCFVTVKGHFLATVSI